MIEVVVNGAVKHVPAGLDVLRLLAFLGIETSRVAVELDRHVVRKTAWETTVIPEGAKVEVVWFVGGG